jgi:hypothetical protein
MVLVSTDSPMDLSMHNTRLVAFSRELPNVPERALLKFRNKWFLGSAHGCSCGFRHLCEESVSLGFGEPEEWFQEVAEDIEATAKAIKVFRLLVEIGVSVECISVWAHGEGAVKDLRTLEIRMQQLNDNAFRFFENYRFSFLP